MNIFNFLNSRSFVCAQVRCYIGMRRIFSLNNFCDFKLLNRVCECGSSNKKVFILMKNVYTFKYWKHSKNHLKVPRSTSAVAEVLSTSWEQVSNLLFLFENDVKITFRYGLNGIFASRPFNSNISKRTECLNQILFGDVPRNSTKENFDWQSLDIVATGRQLSSPCASSIVHWGTRLPFRSYINL